MQTPPPPPSGVTPAADVPPPVLGQTPSIPEGAAEADAVTPELYALEERVTASANWFFWIAGLSLVNSLLALLNIGFGLAVGLGVTQLIDAGFQHQYPNSPVRFAALLFDLIPLGFYALMGFLAQKRRWAFIVGGIFYALDAALCAMVEQWISLALHAWVLFAFFGGFKAAGELAKLRAYYAANGVVPAPPPPPV